MVRTGLEKSLKKHHVLEKSLRIEKLLDILEKSLNFPQKSLNIFESSLSKNNLRLKKKHALRKGMIESIAIHKFSLVIMKVFSYDFGVPWHGSFSVI